MCSKMRFSADGVWLGLKWISLYFFLLTNPSEFSDLRERCDWAKMKIFEVFFLNKKNIFSLSKKKNLSSAI